MKSPQFCAWVGCFSVPMVLGEMKGGKGVSSLCWPGVEALFCYVPCRWFQTLATPGWDCAWGLALPAGVQVRGRCLETAEWMRGPALWVPNDFSVGFNLLPKCYLTCPDKPGPIAGECGKINTAPATREAKECLKVGRTALVFLLMQSVHLQLYTSVLHRDSPTPSRGGRKEKDD